MREAPSVALRVDASAAIGTGHLRRCLSLAQALLEQGAKIRLVSRRLDNVAAHLLGDAPCPVVWLNTPAPQSTLEPIRGQPPHHAWAGVSQAQDAHETIVALRSAPPDWVVVDHYAFDASWHDAVRDSLGCRLLVIDDTADRLLAADTLLDHNWAEDHRVKYADRIVREPHWLTGPRYALLSPAYRDAVRYQFQPEVRSLGIFIGGTDPGGASSRVLKVCRESGFRGPIEVVSTAANPQLAELHAACAASSATTLTLDAPDLAAFFARHDLQIGAGGGATWERCCIGAPTIGLVLAANQSVVVPALDRLGALRAARLDTDRGNPTLSPLSEVLPALLRDPHARRALSERASTLVDGRGSQRVALSLLRNALSLRPATADDAMRLHAWRNHPAVRAVSSTTDPIEWAAHKVWLQRVLAAEDRWLFVAEVGRLPVGCIRFDRLDGGRLEVSLYLDPDLQGLGLGTRLLFEGEHAMRDRLDTGFVVEACVVPGNAASQRLFETCGYHGGPLQYRKTVGPTPVSATVLP